jgi:hypothetical protein
MHMCLTSIWLCTHLLRDQLVQINLIPETQISHTKDAGGGGGGAEKN